jgi:hypothetical protein
MDKQAFTIKELLEHLDGSGLVLTDDDLIENGLAELGLDFRCRVSKPEKSEKIEHDPDQPTCPDFCIKCFSVHSKNEPCHIVG